MEKFLEIINAMKDQFTRITGQSFEENASETEVLAVMESTPTTNEANEAISSKISELNEAIYLQATQISAINEALSALPTAITSEQMSEAISLAVKAGVDPLKNAFAAEITSLKNLAEGMKKLGGENTDATTEAIKTNSKETVQKTAKIFGKERMVSSN
ncbi:MAG: hypothetical protein ABI851_12170 [Saprospiraceae bacterium]